MAMRGPVRERREHVPVGSLRDPVQLLALGFGAGLAPRAPGTAGSALALLPGWLMLEWPIAVRIAVVVALLAAGIAICGAGARRLGVHDHPAIVFDEIVGMLATLLAAAAGVWWHLPLAFVLFRIFDIAKPWPIGALDRGLRGGAGIVLDDLLAAVYAAAGLIAVRTLLPAASGV